MKPRWGKTILRSDPAQVLRAKWQGFWFDWAVARNLLRQATALVEEKNGAAK